MFKDIDIKFVDKEITPFGGLSLFFKMLERCNFGQVLQECGLPEQGSNRGYKPWQLVLGLFAGVWRVPIVATSRGNWCWGCLQEYGVSSG